jgi:hypothetical protein
VQTIGFRIAVIYQRKMNCFFCGWHCNHLLTSDEEWAINYFASLFRPWSFV